MARNITITILTATMAALVISLFVKPSLPNFGQDHILVLTVCADQELPRTGEIQVPDGCVVAGDIILVVNGKDVLPDSVSATGFVLQCNSGCKIKASNGASVSTRLPGEIAQEMLTTGCGNTATGCDIATALILTDHEDGCTDMVTIQVADNEAPRAGSFLCGDRVTRESNEGFSWWSAIYEYNCIRGYTWYCPDLD